MGKGDKKSKKGKRHIGSTGVKRPKKKKNRKPVKVEAAPVAEGTKKPKAPAKAAAKKTAKSAAKKTAKGKE